MQKLWLVGVHGTEVSPGCRFPAEKGIDANKGLNIAQDLLEPIKKQFSWISYSDLWTLAGAVAIAEMGGECQFPHSPKADFCSVSDIIRTRTS